MGLDFYQGLECHTVGGGYRPDLCASTAAGFDIIGARYINNCILWALNQEYCIYYTSIDASVLLVKFVRYLMSFSNISLRYLKLKWVDRCQFRDQNSMCQGGDIFSWVDTIYLMLGNFNFYSVHIWILWNIFLMIN